MIWPVVWHTADLSGGPPSSAPLYGVLAFKATIGVVSIPLGYRAFGIGLLLSIAVGFLIFFGTCAAHL